MAEARARSDGGRERSRFPFGLAAAATLVLIGAVALIWLVGVPFGSGVCPAVYPAPTNCSASYRAGTGLVATAALLAVHVATMLSASLWRPAARTVVGSGIVLLALGAVASIAAAAWSPGFPLGS